MAKGGVNCNLQTRTQGFFLFFCLKQTKKTPDEGFTSLQNFGFILIRRQQNSTAAVAAYQPAGCMQRNERTTVQLSSISAIANFSSSQSSLSRPYFIRAFGTSIYALMLYDNPTCTRFIATAAARTVPFGLFFLEFRDHNSPTKKKGARFLLPVNSPPVFFRNFGSYYPLVHRTPTASPPPQKKMTALVLVFN